MDNENNFNEQQENISPEYGGAITGESPDAIEGLVGQQASLEAQQAAEREQDKLLLDALDKALEKRSREIKQVRSKRPLTRSEKMTAGIVNKGVGIVSLGLILIFLGIVMIIMLFSSEPDYYLPLKLSPIAAILVGVEILFNQLITRGRFKINIPSILISTVLTVGCCAAGVILHGSVKEEKIEYNSRTIAAQIYDRTYKELRNSADLETVEVEVDLNPNGEAASKGLEALSSGDKIVINIDFGGGFANPKDFAYECKKIIDGYRIMGINVMDFHFSNDSAFNSYRLDVEGKFVQDYSESRLAEMVNHVYIEDFSYLEDLNDLMDENADSENNSDI